MPDRCPHDAKIDAIYRAVEQSNRTVERLERLISGTDGRPDTGMVVRLDRIEQHVQRTEERESNRSKALTAAVLSGVVSLVVGAIGWLRHN